MFFFFFFPEDKHITGNKGEWSELYTLLRLLADGKVHAGDENLNRLAEYYPIISILRHQQKDYKYLPDSKRGEIVILEDEKECLRLPISEFDEEAQKLLESIKSVKGAKKKSAFEIPNAEKFMRKIGCDRLKAPSSNKADIHICIHDLSNDMHRNLGFSIKSQLGEPSTLLNAGKTTNFTYKITGCNFTEEDIIRLNSIESHKSRLDAIIKAGAKFEFKTMDNETFCNNLIFIDGSMPQFIAECLLHYNFSDTNKISEVVEHVAEQNPLCFSGANVSAYYKMKMKRLLFDSAMGMTPATTWDGQYSTDGGYLVVKDDGDIVCYHFYNINRVQDYLFQNTRFENASRTKHQYGSLYRDENGEVCIKLNLQIRFIK